MESKQNVKQAVVHCFQGLITNRTMLVSSAYAYEARWETAAPNPVAQTISFILDIHVRDNFCLAMLNKVNISNIS